MNNRVCKKCGKEHLRGNPKNYCKHCWDEFKLTTKEYVNKNKESIKKLVLEELCEFVKLKNRFPHASEYSKMKNNIGSDLFYVQFIVTNSNIPEKLYPYYKEGCFKIIKVCEICGSDADGSYNRIPICSEECIDEYGHEKYKDHMKKISYKNCYFCGERFFIRDSNKHGEFCSNKCKKLSKKFQSNFIYYDDKDYDQINDCYYKHEFECEYCNSKFYTNKENQRFCTIKCKEDYRLKKSRSFVFNSESSNISFVSVADRKNNDEDLELELQKYKDKFVITNNGLNNWNIGGFTNRLKDLVRERDGNECYICGEESRLHVHHIIPRVFGGTHHPDNLITLCSHCHMVIEKCSEEDAVEKSVKRVLNKS